MAYPFPQHCYRFAQRCGQAMRLQAVVEQEGFGGFPHDLIAPSAHWPWTRQREPSQQRTQLLTHQTTLRHQQTAEQPQKHLLPFNAIRKFPIRKDIRWQWGKEQWKSKRRKSNGQLNNKKNWYLIQMELNTYVMNYNYPHWNSDVIRHL